MLQMMNSMSATSKRKMPSRYPSKSTTQWQNISPWAQPKPSNPSSLSTTQKTSWKFYTTPPLLEKTNWWIPEDFTPNQLTKVSSSWRHVNQACKEEKWVILNGSQMTNQEFQPPNTQPSQYHQSLGFTFGFCFSYYFIYIPYHMGVQ